MDWTYNATAFSSESFKGSQMSAEFFFLIAIILVLLQLRTRKVRLWVIWLPLLFLLPITAATIAADYSGPGTLLLSVAGFAVGCALGLVIGSRMEVKTDDTGRIVLKGSLVAVTIWIVVLGLKIFGRGIVGDMGIISLDDLSAMLLALTLGTITARRVYVTLKYLQLKKQTQSVEPTVKPVQR
jgi:membrane protein CcdC involved in cytochrome C biogenesis